MIVAWWLLILLVFFLGYIFFFYPKLPPEVDDIIEDVLKSELPEIVKGDTGFANSNGLRIWYESLSPEGASRGPVLLIMAMGGNALDWPSKFVQNFVNSGYQTIRFDHRGTGMSDRVEDWSHKNPYSLADMADDAIAVLDMLQVQKSHVIGLSMGGMVAQEVATNYPDRVTSLTLLSTSGYVGDPNLPGLTSGYLLRSIVKGLPLFKYRLLGGEKNLIKERIAKTVVALGDEELDIQETAELVLYDLRKRRGVSISGAIQQQVAVTISGSRYEKLKTLNIPTLVIHGIDDPLFPVEHGKKLKEIIPRATGLWLNNVGHIFPYPNMRDVNEKINLHLSTNS